MLDAVETRLKTLAPDLGGRVDQLLSLEKVLKTGGLPETTTTFLVPLGLTGGAVEYATGELHQDTVERLGVLLVLRSRDRTGEAAIARLRDLRGQVIAALVGWSPGTDFGAFTLARASLGPVLAGAVLYLLEFTITDQLRIPT